MSFKLGRVNAGSPLEATANTRRLEAKENLRFKPETQTLASITYQKFLPALSASGWQTGTAKTEEVEFEKNLTSLEVTRCNPQPQPRSAGSWWIKV